MKSQRRAK